MESGRRKISFTVIVGQEDMIIETVKKFNRDYKKNFVIDEIIYEEVEFATISADEVTKSDIFNLGAYFGG